MRRSGLCRARILGRAVALPDLPWLGLKGPLVGPEESDPGDGSVTVLPWPAPGNGAMSLPASFRPLTALALAAVLGASGPASAKDLGVRGATWPIAEPDLLEEIEARLGAMQRSGELARIERQAQTRARSRLEEPDPVPGIAPARVARSRMFDPAIPSNVTSGCRTER